jgi:UDP-N-acetylmuramate--alanine ligase
VYSYGLNDQNCDFYIDNVRYNNESCIFDLNYLSKKIENIHYKLGGNHNLENALAASSVSLLNGATEDDVRKGLESFEGIVRRFDYRIKTPNRIYIDDYAHHPGEITAFLSAVRLLYPKRRITGIFQPHLFSRTSDFYREFAESLSLCDELILLPIYPAREKPMIGVNSEMILELVTTKNKQICQKDELLAKLEEINPELLVSMGAGDIDMFIEPIEKLFSK